MRGSPVKKLDTMERRIPKNPKYSEVASVVDSGPTTRKVTHITTREYLKRRDELFRRVKPLSLYHLLVDNEEKVESIYDIPEKEEAKSATVVVTGADDSAEVHDKPYLILDVREESEFDECHIMEARSFPASRISQDRVSPELFRYKNKEDRLIVLYDADEKIGAAAATLMVQKGWENVYLLTGGLRVTAAKFPLLIEGELPEVLKMEPPKTGASRYSSAGSTRMHTARTGRSVAGTSVAGSVRGGPGASTESIAGSSVRTGRR